MISKNLFLETYLSGKKDDDEQRKSQLEADVLSLDTNGTLCKTTEVTTETLTPTLTPIRLTKSEPNIWLEFDQLVDNYTNSNAFIDFSEFLFDSNRHKSKTSHLSRLSKSGKLFCFIFKNFISRCLPKTLFSKSNFLCLISF